MTPAQAAEQIARTHLPDGPKAAQLGLAEAIRWAIVRGQIDARQPPEVELARAPAIVRDIVDLVDGYLVRMRGASYVELANELRTVRTRLLAAHGIVPDKPVDGTKKPGGKAEELKRVTGE